MRRILVPLDGTPFGEEILGEARRVAGSDGTLILVHDASQPAHHNASTGALTVLEGEIYLENIASALRAQGVQVEVHTTFLNSISLAIDAAAELFHAHMIACSTHGRSVVGRLAHGGAAWRALAGSRVPVLLRHADEPSEPQRQQVEARAVLVPLDGSRYAEQALPLAQQLAREWGARIVLARVVATTHAFVAPYTPTDAYAVEFESDVAISRAYLKGVAATLTGDVETHVHTGGSVVDGLVDVATATATTDVVMASHGRTALQRVVLGSVADSLIHRLHLPIIVIPALAQASAHAMAHSRKFSFETSPH